MLGVLGVLIAVPFLYNRVDEEIRRHVEARFAQYYPALTIRVRAAQLVEGQGIEIRGVTFSQPGVVGPDAEPLYIDEMMLSCQTDLKELLTGEPRITRVKIVRPTLRSTRRSDGTWTASQLLPIPKLSGHSCDGSIENGTLEFHDPTRNPSSIWPVRDVNLTWTNPDRAKPKPGEPARVRVRGYVTGDHARRVTVDGSVQTDGRGWNLSGTIEGLEISRKLRDALPAELGRSLDALGPLTAQASGNYSISSDPEGKLPCLFQASGNVVGGRIDDPRLPYPLMDVQAKVTLSNQGFSIDEMTARSGQTTLGLSCRRWGFDAASPLWLKAQAKRLTLDPQLLGALPDQWQQLWYKYLPAGEIDADLELTFDGKAWRPDLAVKCLDVAFTYHKFPYRLERGAGDLRLKDDVLSIGLTAYAGGQPVRLDGQIRHPSPEAAGWMEVQGDHLPLDEKLFVALPDKSPAVVRSLHPEGTFDFFFRIERDKPGSPMRRYAKVNLNRSSIQFEQFPYPINNIRGTLELVDRQWTFRNLEGTNDAARITCRGSLTPTADGSELALDLAGTNVTLKEELRDAMRPGMQQLWNSLRPQGAMDLESRIRYRPGQNGLSVWVRAWPLENASIEPVQFPYRMEVRSDRVHPRSSGVLTYADGTVWLEGLKAKHGRVVIGTDGRCEFLPDGSWTLRLEKLWIDQLRTDPELVQALPERLKKAVIAIKAEGAVNVRGDFDLAHSGVPGEPLTSGWNLNLDVHPGSGLDCGVRVDDISGGSVRLVGDFDGRRFRSRGELDIASLKYKDVQITEVRGPFWIDDTRVLFGIGSEAPQTGRPRRSITGRLCGGTVYGDASVSLEAVPTYSLRATLSGGDLAQCVRELTARRQELRGTVLANVRLQGTGKSLNGLAGQGNIQLRDADIYQLPLMVSMLKILSIRTPDTSAFSTSDIDFRIKGNHVYFDRIDFNGDAISLCGKGAMNFQRDINLNFYAVVGRDEFKIPLVRAIGGGVSQNIMSIRVDGTLDNPEPRRELLPGVSQALQQLQADLQKSPERPLLPPPPAARSPQTGMLPKK
ncbi:MAG: hypothetical protein ACYC35_02555 [Pirellulales bacterium]